MTENRTETLTTYITDMHALVNHGLRAFDVHLKSFNEEKHHEAVAATQEFHRTLTGHLSLLDARAKGLGGKVTSPVKDAVSAVAGFAAGIIGAVRPEEAAKAIRDTYTYLSHVAISYLMLFTTASGFGDRETANLAEQGYRDVARMIVHIDRIMPALVIQELREDGLSIQDVAQEARAMVGRSWTRDSSATGTAV